MPDKNELTRRRLLQAGTGTAVGFGGIGTVSAIEGVTDEVETPEAVDDVADEVPADETAAAEVAEPEAVVASADRVPILEVEDRTETVPLSGIPEQASPVRPGSQLFVHNPTEGTVAACTANFVWRSSGTYFLGTAGHCFLPEGDASEDAARAHEEGYDVSQLEVSMCADCTLGGATGLTVMSGSTFALGDVAYARASSRDPGGGTNVGNDFGLVEIPDAAVDRGLVDPSVPQFGGPRGVAGGAIPAGSPVNKYGAGIGNGETFATMGANGSSLGDLGTDHAWFAGIRATPGDSGAPLQSTRAGGGLEGDDAGGVLTHLTTNGIAGTTMDRGRQLVSADLGLGIQPVLAGRL